MITGNAINTLLFIFHCTFQYGYVNRKITISTTSDFQIAADDKIISFHPLFFKLCQFIPVM